MLVKKGGKSIKVTLNGTSVGYVKGLMNGKESITDEDKAETSVRCGADSCAPLHLVLPHHLWKCLMGAENSYAAEKNSEVQVKSQLPEVFLGRLQL